MRMIKFNFFVIVAMIIILLPFNVMLNTSLGEVNQMTKYFIHKEYDSFTFVSSIDDQLETSVYDQSTTSALHYLASVNYDYRWAQKNISNISEYDLTLDRVDIGNKLKNIYTQISFKSNFLGYTIFFIKWLIFINLVEGIRLLLGKFYKKFFEKTSK
ncbi:MAG: hypothetical protein BGO41_15365 [Clostridiales bacterium 38-18]|mgnify:CR=1 FL=1|nr:MAG: hypothetical protein BGO41_15365 [Clostridiales bacterium 38-18]